MEFVHHRNFEHQDVTVPKSNKSQQHIKFSAYCYAFEHDKPAEQFLFVGLSSGKIFYYKKKSVDNRYLVAQGKDHERVELESPQAHKGEIRKLIHTYIDGLEVLISASADRTIKLWEPRNTKGNKCFQTIIGHERSLLDMIYLEKVQLLFTSSTDGTMRVWRIDQARQLLLYPWFIPFQTVTELPTALSGQQQAVWLTCFDKKQGESLQVFAGDSEGSLYIFEALENWREQENNCLFRLQYKQELIHRIGIIQVLLVIQENLIFTISYDQTLKWFEATEREQETHNELMNPNKTIFTCLCWDYNDHELYAADEKGYVYVINVYQEDKLFSKQLVKERIKNIEIIQRIKKEGEELSPLDPRFLLIQTDYGLKSFKIKKGVKTHDMEGHTDSIIKIIVLEPSRMIANPFEKIPDTPKVITASFDNSILLWDYEKLEIITRMEAPEHSELSCMTFLPKCCLVATGHEDGAIRLWNLEINSSVLLKCHDSQRHREAISCILGCEWNGSEYLIAGDYQGRITVWEISEKSTGGSDKENATIFPQLRHVIENWKNFQWPVNAKHKDRNEILTIAFWEQPKDGMRETSGDMNFNPDMSGMDNDSNYGAGMGDSPQRTGMAGMMGDERQRNSEGWIIVGGNFVELVIYSIRNGTYEKQLRGHEDSVTCMTISGNLLFTGSDDTTIRLWNLQTMYTPTEPIGKHEEGIQDLTCLTKNGLLISCAFDGKIICWNVRADESVVPVQELEQGKQLHIHDQVHKENQQLRCLGAVTDSGMLLIGTNTFAILTQNMTDWVNYYDPRDYEGLMPIRQAIAYGDDEERKEGEDYMGEEPDELQLIMMAQEAAMQEDANRAAIIQMDY